MPLIDDTICPLCKTKNNCMAHVKETCWCNAGEIPKDLIAMLPKEIKGKACICLSCIQSFKDNPDAFKKHLN